MTRFADSRFSVGPTSASAAKAYRDNYDAIFRKKPTPDALKSLPQEEFDALPEVTDDQLQAALDEARPPDGR